MPRNNRVDYDRLDICKLTDIRKTEFFSSSTESILLNPQMKSSARLSNYDRRYKNSDDCQRRSRSRTKERSSNRHFSRNINIQKKIVDENYTYKSILRDDYQHRRNSRPVSKDRIHSPTQPRRRSDSNGSSDFNDKFNLENFSPSKRHYRFQNSSRVQEEDSPYLEKHKPIFNKSSFLHSNDKNDSKHSAYGERELIHINGEDHRERLNHRSDFSSSSREVIVQEYQEFCRSISRNSLTDNSFLPHGRKVSEQRGSFDDGDDDRMSSDSIFRRHINESNLNKREHSYPSNYEPVPNKSIENVCWARKNRIETKSDRLLLNDDSYMLDKPLKDQRGETQYRQDYKPATGDEIEDEPWSRQQRIGISFDRPQPRDYIQSSKNISDERIEFSDEDNNRKYDNFKAGSYVSDRLSETCHSQRSLRNTRWRSRSRSREKQTNSETVLHSAGVNADILNSVKNQAHDFKNRTFHDRNESNLELNKYENRYQQSYKLRDGIDNIWQRKQRIETNSNVLELNDGSDNFPRFDKNEIEEKINRCDIDRKYDALRKDSSTGNRLNKNVYNLNLENYSSNRRENLYQKKHLLTPKDDIENDSWSEKQRNEIHFAGPISTVSNHYFPRCDKNLTEEKRDHFDVDRKYDVFRTDSSISSRLNKNDYNLNLESYSSNRRENPYQKKHLLSPKDEIENDSWPGKQRKEINFVGPQSNDNSHYFPPTKNEQKMDIDDRKYKDIDDRKHRDIDDRKYKDFRTNYNNINDKQTADYRYQRISENIHGRSNSRSKEPVDGFKEQIRNETLNCDRFKINDVNAYQDTDSDLRDRIYREHANELKFNHRRDTNSDRLELSIDNDHLFGRKFEDFDKSENVRKYNEFEPNNFINNRQFVSEKYLSKSNRSRSRERNIKELSPSNNIRFGKRKIYSEITDEQNYLSRISEPRFKRHRSNSEELENRNIPNSVTSMRYNDGTYRERDSDLYSRESPIGNTETEICDQKEEILYKAKSNSDFEGLNYWYNFFKSKLNENAHTVGNSSKNKNHIEIYCMVCNQYYNSVALFQIHTAHQKHFENETETFGNNPPPPIIVRRSPLVVQDITKHSKNDSETFNNVPPPPVIVKSSPPVVRDVNKKWDILKHKKIEYVSDTKPDSWVVIKEDKIRRILETSLYTGRSNVDFVDLYKKYRYFAAKEEDNKTIILKCNLCDVYVFCEQTFELHTNSKRHMKALHNYRGKAPLPTVNKRKVVFFRTGIQCDICKQQCFDSVFALNKHMLSKKHKQNFRDYLEKISAASAGRDIDKTNSDELVETASVDRSSKATVDVEQDDNPTNDTFYYCSICDLTLNSLHQYDSHLTSKNHANKKRMVENLTDD